MKVEMRLKQLLMEHGKSWYGLEKQIAEQCRLHRHTVGKLMRNEAKNPSLEVLGRICRWLVANGIPADILPGALFGLRPTSLWRAIGNSEMVTFYIGMYEHERNRRERDIFDSMSVARYDATVVAKFTRLLSTKTESSQNRPMVGTEYVPFKFSPHDKEVCGKGFEKDKRRAEVIFQKMRNRNPRESVLVLGSQRVNYLNEFLVADLFGCKPFNPAVKLSKVPFYVCYRGIDRPVPSCFGGRSAPHGWAGAAMPGIYYRSDSGNWRIAEWREKEQGAGVVIVLRDGDAVELAMFGFSGRCTNAIGTQLIENGDSFWPRDVCDAGSKGSAEPDEATITFPEKGKGSRHRQAVKKGKEIGIYICRVAFSDNQAKRSSYADKDCEDDKVHKIILLSASILGRYL